MRRRPPHTVNHKKLLFSGLLLLLLVGAGTWIFASRDAKNTRMDTAAITDDEKAETTSDTPTAQSDFAEGDEEKVVSDNTRNEGVVVDNQGELTETPNQSQWSVSKTGEVTVYGPAKNSTITTGSKLTGASGLSSISFRLIDDASGVIAQGQIAVVNGKFSGTFNFSTNAGTGRLDVFGVRSDGVEFSNVEIPVRFN